MKPQRPIVVAGSIAIDRIMSFSGSYADHLRPENLDSVSVSIFLDALTDSYGGVGANIAYTLALLGEEPYLIGSVGPDAVEYLEKLAKHGVNITHVHESALSTATFNVITDRDQNQVGGFYPGAMFDSDSQSLADWYDKDPVVVIAPHDPKAMRRQIEECKERGLSLCYDIGQQVSNTSPDDLRFGLEAAEVLILNEYELGVLSQKIGQSVEDICAHTPLVITTFGPRGSLLRGTLLETPVNIGVAEVSDVVDPTGAGDAYRGGFFYGYAQGWPVATCAQLGATCASFAVETMGTQAHSPSRREIEDRYMATFNESITLETIKETS